MQRVTVHKCYIVATVSCRIDWDPIAAGKKEKKADLKSVIENCDAVYGKYQVCRLCLSPTIDTRSRDCLSELFLHTLWDHISQRDSPKDDTDCIVAEQVSTRSISALDLCYCICVQQMHHFCKL